MARPRLGIDVGGTKLLVLAQWPERRIVERAPTGAGFTGRDLDDTSARWMQGFLVLADAINRAGSTDPAKIQKALQDTDLKPEQLMIGYRGVKFDETGQNTLSATYLIQLQGKEYKSVWPQDRATAKLVWPMTGWRTRNQ